MSGVSTIVETELKFSCIFAVRIFCVRRKSFCTRSFIKKVKEYVKRIEGE